MLTSHFALWRAATGVRSDTAKISLAEQVYTYIEFKLLGYTLTLSEIGHIYCMGALINGLPVHDSALIVTPTVTAWTEPYMYVYPSWYYIVSHMYSFIIGGSSEHVSCIGGATLGRGEQG